MWCTIYVQVSVIKLPIVKAQQVFSMLGVFTTLII